MICTGVAGVHALRGAAPFLIFARGTGCARFAPSSPPCISAFGALGYGD